MAKNTKQIALIQHRRGKLSELPTQLNEAELGFATDTNELFIGNPNNPSLMERIDSNIFPYGNVQILTEFTENLKKITYTYKSNTDVIARLPIVVVGTTSNPVIVPNTSLYINSIEVNFEESSSISKIVEIINKTEGLNVKAFIHNNAFIGLITTGTEITLENGKTYGQGIVERLGFGSDNFYSVTSSLPPERTLQEVLDDYCSVKNFGAFGDGVADDSDAVFNAIVALNKAGDNPRYYRTLFFPAGTYNITSKTLPLPYGAYLKGEGIGRTIIKSIDYLNAIMATMDSNMNLGSVNEYGLNAETPKFITVEDMTIDVSSSMTSSLLLLSTCHNVTFRNVEFIGKDITNLVRISDNLNVSNSSHIIFDKCIFNTAESAIISYDSIEHLIVKNCIFKNVKNEAIILNPNENAKIINSIISENIFNNCSNTSKLIISLGENTEYVSVIHNKFDEEVTNFVSETKPYKTESSLNYTDILDATLSDKRILQFKFTQPIWQFIDYLMNPNGEYLLQAHYNSTIINDEESIKPVVNSLILEQGDDTNDNTVTLGGSNPIENVNINAGAYGDLHLGKNIDYTKYLGWEYDREYKVGTRLEQQNDKTLTVYECIKDHISSDTIRLDNVEYWQEIGTFTPSIVLNKDLNLNGSPIKDNVGNITFYTTNDNVLMIDNTNSVTPYAERIPPYLDAIPNVDYVNRIAQTTIRDTINYNILQQSPTNRKEIVYFDPYMYGDFINMNKISINVRRPYYPVTANINENTLVWKPQLKYYVGDIVKLYMDNPSIQEFEMYISTLQENVLNWVKYEYSNILKPTEDELDGDGEPLSSFGVDGNYAVTYGSSEENFVKTLFVKVAGNWYEVGSADWANLFNSYAVGQPNKTYTANSIVSIDSKEITLTGTTVDEAVTIINTAFADKTVVASNVNGALRLDKVKGKLVYNDIQFSAFESLGFPIDNNTSEFITIQPTLVSTVDATITPDNNIANSVWMKLSGEEYYYACTENHIASDSFEVDAGMTGQTIHWAEVYKKGINPETQEEFDIPDIKYVSIVASNNVDSHRLLFGRQIIDVAKRNINSVYEKDWVQGTEYNIGDRVAFKGRYYECLKAHTASSMYDLNTPDLWLAVAEEGYNYHFDFERNIYKLDDEGNIIPDDDFIVDYNFSGYTFYLELYDANGKLIPQFKIPNDDTSVDNNIQVNPSGYVLITINYVRGEQSENQTNP